MIKTNESFKYKIWINLGFGLLLLTVLLISIFTNKIELFERVMEEFSGILIALVLINGLEWLRLEGEKV